MDTNVKSGKEILKDFFENIQKMDDTDHGITQMLNNLFSQGKLTDANVKNELQKLREQYGNKDKIA